MMNTMTNQQRMTHNEKLFTGDMAELNCTHEEAVTMAELDCSIDEARQHTALGLAAQELIKNYGYSEVEALEEVYDTMYM